jgi:hypothetical protein
VQLVALGKAAASLAETGTTAPATAVETNPSHGLTIAPASVACCAVAATEPPPHDAIAGTNATEKNEYSDDTHAATFRKRCENARAFELNSTRNAVANICTFLF